MTISSDSGHKRIAIQILQNHFNKYGENDLRFEIIEHCYAHLLEEREQFYIDALNPHFNICRIARNTKGVPQSEETRKQRSSAVAKAYANKSAQEMELIKESMRASALRRSPIPEEVNGFKLVEANHVIKGGHRLSLWECFNCHRHLVKRACDLTKRKLPCECMIVRVGRKPGKPRPRKARTIRKDNTSGFIGITFDKHHGKYRARVKRNGKCLAVPGSFTRAVDAHEARLSYLSNIHQ